MKYWNLARVKGYNVAAYLGDPVWKHKLTYLVGSQCVGWDNPLIIRNTPNQWGLDGGPY